MNQNNDVINVIKEIPMKVKKRLSSYCMKLIKEKKIRRVSNIDNMIPSLKELDNKINQIRKEINLIDVNEYYTMHGSTTAHWSVSLSTTT